MLTIFTIPKAFHGHNRVIQTNAARSWLRLRPKCQVILLGDDDGTAEAAAELGVLHLPDVARGEAGTPLVSSMFSLAQGAAEFPRLCYINADIILLDDFLPAVTSVNLSPLLMVGQRWDLDVTGPLDYGDERWESRLRTRLSVSGKLHPRSGIDYFIYSRGLYDDIPPFAVGRTAWDNWLIYRARRRKAAVVDASGVITAVHQNHDYAHTAGGETAVWKGQEALRNFELAGKGEHVLTLEHATWRLTQQGLKRALTPRDIYFRIDAMTRLYPRLSFLREPLRVAGKMIKGIRSVPGATTP